MNLKPWLDTAPLSNLVDLNINSLGSRKKRNGYYAPILTRLFLIPSGLICRVALVPLFQRLLEGLGDDLLLAEVGARLLRLGLPFLLALGRPGRRGIFGRRRRR